ncbi:phenylacetate-CoA ligase [Stackebrandtia endophytica]|uniref:Phenylacetate-CoA ligase n=1 Tax=Stackebrandtia endophytica TaxID=1496996 RepID=A0A543AT43_9ACTN|nr:phenylacetate--CoA ligase family protein [Stackebrandtia endophytica]TQL75726.1 phenylacetate-CoA ligase [Stackebrandtia endophytica]
MPKLLRSSIALAPVARNVVIAHSRDRLKAEAVKELQSRKLRELVGHAHRNVPYFRNTLSEKLVASVQTAADLQRLPILDRKTVHDLPENELLADGFTPENTRAATTSGSSGIPVTFRNSERDLGYLRATYLQDMLACGLKLFDRIGYFRTASFLRHPLERFGVMRNLHIDTSLPLDQQVEAFLTARPTFLFGFPNVIGTIVEELQRRGIEYDQVHTVVLGGERLTPSARANILSYFGARAHEIYASVEMFTAARTCPSGALHLKSGNVVVEVEHDDGTVSVEDGEGEVVVTRLNSEAMPLLRYRVGDRVRIRPNDCDCKVAHTPIVEEITGRSQERLTGPDGRQIHGDFLTKVIERNPEVHRMQLVQHRPGQVTVSVVLDPNTPEVVARIHSGLMAAISGFTFEVVAVDEITPEANGKIKTVKVEAS